MKHSASHDRSPPRSTIPKRAADGATGGASGQGARGRSLRPRSVSWPSRGGRWSGSGPPSSTPVMTTRTRRGIDFIMPRFSVAVGKRPGHRRRDSRDPPVRPSSREKPDRESIAVSQTRECTGPLPRCGPSYQRALTPCADGLRVQRVVALRVGPEAATEAGRRPWVAAACARTSAGERGGASPPRSGR
jgi:hypothetical protein